MTDNLTQPTQDAEQREQARKERYMRQYWRQEEHFYRSGGLRLTAQARADLTAIENEYSPLFDAANRAIMDASTTKPDVGKFYIGISPSMNPDEWKAAQQQATDAITAWEATAPEEWRAAQLHLDAIIAEYNEKRGAVYLATYRQQYEALGNEPGNIVQLAKAHVDWLIEDQYKDYKAVSETSLSMSAHDVVALGGSKWKLDATETRKRIIKALMQLHFKALGDNTQAIDEIKAYIDKAIKSSRYIAPEGTPGVREKIVFRKRAGTQEEPATDTPLDLPALTSDFIYGPFAVMPISRLIKEQRNLANKEEARGKLNSIGVGGEGEESASVKVKITTENMIPVEAIEIQNVIGEMIQANGNKPIKVTWAQIWRAFAILEDGAWVSAKNQEYTRDIVKLLAKAEGRIDFTQQVEKHKGIKKDPNYDYSKTILEGPLVMRDEITVLAGGHEVQGAILYRQPLFYMHSQLTGQITRIDRAVLDTTTKRIVDAEGNKRTAETKNNDIGFILLKRHLARQVEQMKKEKAANKGKYEGRRNFEGISKELGDKPLTAKQMRTLREDVEMLCTRWKIQGYIQGYELYRNKGSRAYAGVEITL